MSMYKPREMRPPSVLACIRILAGEVFHGSRLQNSAKSTQNACWCTRTNRSIPCNASTVRLGMIARTFVRSTLIHATPRTQGSGKIHRCLSHALTSATGALKSTGGCFEVDYHQILYAAHGAGRPCRWDTTSGFTSIDTYTGEETHQP